MLGNKLIFGGKNLHLDCWYSCLVKMGFGSIPIGLDIGFRSHPRGRREANWFHKTWILASLCSQGSSLPIEAIYLCKYFYWIEDGFKNTLYGLKIRFGKANWFRKLDLHLGCSMLTRL